MSLVDSVYYPTMRLCLENTPLIRIWVKCVSPAKNQGTEGATPLQPTQMVPQLCRGLLKGVVDISTGKCLLGFAWAGSFTQSNQVEVRHLWHTPADARWKIVIEDRFSASKLLYVSMVQLVFHLKDSLLSLFSCCRVFWCCQINLVLLNC